MLRSICTTCYLQDNLAAALDLAAAGYRVFPVRVVWNATKQKYDKVPATEHGFKDATTDEATSALGGPTSRR